jgi:ABC-type transport system substrate-binding protein
VRRALLGQWRDARKPFAAVTSTLLSLVVVTTTLVITKPPIFIGPAHLGYDFSYAYHAPTKQGGSVTVALGGPLQTLTPFAPGVAEEIYYGLWQSCLTQLPDVALGFASYQPDQCTGVPTVENGGQSPDYKTTIIHLDPRAVWSDGVPVTADDYRFFAQLAADPNVCGCPPYVHMHLTAVDPHTIRID